MKLKMFALFVGLVFFFCLSALSKDKEEITLQAVSYRVITHDFNYSYTTPGRSNTSCYGSGSTYGNGNIYGNTVSWNAITDVDMNCQTVSTPPQTYSGTIRHFEIYNALRDSDGRTYFIGCYTHWIGSKCSSLIPGNVFKAERSGSTLWIYGRNRAGTGNWVKVKYKLLSVR